MFMDSHNELLRIPSHAHNIHAWKTFRGDVPPCPPLDSLIFGNKFTSNQSDDMKFSLHIISSPVLRRYIISLLLISIILYIYMYVDRVCKELFSFC